MAKTAPFSIRVEPETDALIRDIANRERRSRSSVAASLLEEAARMHRFPGIAFKNGETGRRAYVKGSFLDVWQIIWNVQLHEDLKKTLEETHLTESQVSLALAYYDHYQAEIDSMIEANKLDYEDVKQLYPGLNIERHELP